MLFILQDRVVVFAILAAAAERLAAHPAARAALELGAAKCRRQHLDMEYPLHKLVSDWPAVADGADHRPYDGPEILEAVLEDERLDEETRFELYVALAGVFLRTNHSVRAIRLIQADSGSAAKLMPRHFRKLQERVVTLMFTTGNIFAAKAMVSAWPNDRADQARASAYAVHPNPAGLTAQSILRDITDATLRSETLTRRLDHETTQGRPEVAAKLRALRGKPENRPDFLRVIK